MYKTDLNEQDVVNILKGIESTIDNVNEMIAARRFELIDDLLRLADTDHTELYPLLSLARSTFPLKRCLKNWD